MKNRNRNRIHKISAFLLILALLLGMVSTSENEDSASAESGAVYSDWLRLNELLEPQNAQSGTRDLSLLLRESALLDAEGNLLAADGVWPVEQGADYRVRYRFGETPGDESRQFAAEGGPLVFALPGGLSAGDENLTLPVRVALDNGESVGAVCEYDAAAGTLSVSWDAESGAAIRASEGASFEVEIPAVFAEQGAGLRRTSAAATGELKAAGQRMTLNANRSAPGQSSDLADFLDSITIIGAELNDQQQYIIHAGVPYTVEMKFMEITNGLQFDDDGVWSYTFPNGFTPLATSGRFNIGDANNPVWIDYEISGGTLTATVDKMQSPGYNDFLITENAHFTILTDGIIDSEVIEFSSEVTGHFHIDESSNVSVRKVGTYDAKRNKIRFTIQAYSTGNNNENVHIGDTITGSALTLDPSSITVSSNQHESYQESVNYTLNTQEKAFDLTIPTMAHGEIVTVEYEVDVDLSQFSPGQNGTIETTGNKIRIVSDNDPVPEEHEVFVNQISLSSNSKTVLSQEVHDGKTYVTWQIVLNENANMSIDGSEVKDTIDSLSQQYMRYSGTGIHVERYQKDGTSAGAYDVRWGENGLSASQGGSSWTYTIPESDAGQKYRYVITYVTEVDSEKFFQTTTVSNNVHNEYDNDYSGANVETTGVEVKAEKKENKSTVTVDAINKTAETEWEITFTVPPAGLDSAVITDTLPAFLDPAQMRWFYDTYKNGSAYVVAGDLAEGEGFTVDAASQEHKVIITFTKNNGQPGLTGTGLTRTIRVRLTTEADPDWLVFAETESRAKTHVNNAIVKLNGQDIHVQGTATYNTTQYDLKKKLEKTIKPETDPSLPIYVYRIDLTNVNEAAFEDGLITITDEYDSEYLSVFYPASTDYENKIYGYVFGIPSWSTTEGLEEGRRSTNRVIASLSEGRIIFKIDKNDLPMLFGTSYYPKYVISYALQVKDAETLESMKEEALHSDGLSVKMTNIATSDKFGTDELVTEYSIEALKKTKEWEGYNGATGTHDIQFKIEVNPEALQIGDEKMITVKDTISNLSFDYTSIEIDPDNLEGDTLNRVGNSIIFKLHNRKHYTITYTARLIGFQDVEWDNTAVLYGYESGVSDTSSAHSSGSGGFSNYSMNVKKYAEGNMNQGLAATFEIYEAQVKDANGNDIQDPVWTKVGGFTTAEVNCTP